jgi:hypothetical protein
MSGLYYTDMLDVLRAAGVTCQESSTTNGWQKRARSSGGFPSPPLCVFWHHTASSTSPANDLSFMINGSSDAPVGNLLIDRDGVCWPIAAGASNCAGKGGPSSFSRGTIPADSGNTRGYQIEIANNGVGGRWPVAQVNAAFQASNALNARFGNLPTDIITHALGAGGGAAGWTSRKIDPATAAAVEGSWKPRSTNSSGTWHLDDMRVECAARAGAGYAPGPGPINPPTDGGDTVQALVIKGSDEPTYYAWSEAACVPIPGLNWVQAGFDQGLYRNTEPVVYSQAEVDELVAAQGPR